MIRLKGGFDNQRPPIRANPPDIREVTDLNKAAGAGYGVNRTIAPICFIDSVKGAVPVNTCPKCNS